MFSFANHGSITILTPLDDAAEQWVEENIGEHMSWGGGVVIEPRYVGAILEGIVADGLEVS